jgi:hypothetical protein
MKKNFPMLSRMLQSLRRRMQRKTSPSSRSPTSFLKRSKGFARRILTSIRFGKPAPMIHPFIGYRSWEHDPVDGKPQVLTVCDMDYSGTKTYAFNRLGFRGEEFNPKAAKRIFFSGCSYTFGTGLNYEETAAHRFKMLYCEQYGLDPSDVNLLNFAMPGASNDYIVRTMISQCQRVKPDIAVVLFSHVERAEYIDEQALGERVWTVAPWWIEEAVYDHLNPPTNDAKERLELLRNASIGYLYYSTPANSTLNFLRNALLAQYYFKSHNIPYVMHWVDFGQFDYMQRHFALNDMASLLEREHFVDYTNPGRYWCDKAADEAHPGPQSNANIATELFKKYQFLYNH